MKTCDMLIKSSKAIKADLKKSDQRKTVTEITRFFIRNPIFGVTPEVSEKFLNFRPRVSYIVS